jgi:hypothetical protein
LARSALRGAAGELCDVAAERLGGELQALGHRQVRRPGRGELVDGHGGFDREDCGLDDLAGGVGDDAGAEQAAAAGLGDELEQPARVAVDERPRDRFERQDAGVDVEAPLARWYSVRPAAAICGVVKMIRGRFEKSSRCSPLASAFCAAAAPPAAAT